MKEIRFHGRGGQGAVTAAEILAKAAGYDDKYSQGFPAFGVERRGAPVKAFCRISDKPITIRSQVYNPDYLIVLDDSLPTEIVLEGLKENGVIVINTNKDFITEGNFKVFKYDATSLALKILGKPIVNTAILGAFAKATNLVSLEGLLKAVEERFEGEAAELNKKLVEEAYKEMEI